MQLLALGTLKLDMRKMKRIIKLTREFENSSYVGTEKEIE